MSQLFIGTSGYSYPDWKGRFYPPEIPQKDWLTFYSQQFQSVEINATFYGFSREKSFEHWYTDTPENFTFSIKGSRFLTHVRRLQVSKEEIERFVDLLSPLKEKLSCILWQTPGNFGLTEMNFERLERFITLLPKHISQCIEFRDSTWFVDRVWSVLQQNSIGFVMSDSSEFPTAEEITGNFAYIRFHGPSKLYSSRYSIEELQEWAGKIKKWLEKYDVYCYFNNDFYGYAIQNAKQLQRLLNQKTNQQFSGLHF